MIHIQTFLFYCFKITFNNYLNTSLNGLETDMNNLERITNQIEEVKRVMTPEVTEQIRLSTETLSQIGIENLEKLGQNQNEIENLLSEIKTT